MTIQKAIAIIIAVLFLHAFGLVWAYSVVDWFDIPIHIGGGLAMGALALALWNEGIEEVRFKGNLQKHIKWWLIPAIVLGFVSLIGIAWEMHEFLLDQLFPIQTGDVFAWRQPSLADTMLDFCMDILGGVLALIIWKRR